jgi:hypothetical protein
VRGKGHFRGRGNRIVADLRGGAVSINTHKQETKHAIARKVHVSVEMCMLRVSWEEGEGLHEAML